MRELKSNRKCEESKIRTTQTCLKALLRDFRNHSKDPFLHLEEGRHNHIVNESKIDRVRQYYSKQLELPGEMFDQHGDIYFELVLPKRTDSPF